MTARRLTLAVLASLCALAGLLAFAAAPGVAADLHNYLFQFGGVPAEGPHGEPVPLPGPDDHPETMTVDGGEVYLAEGYGFFGMPWRIDKFNAATGAFVAQFPQAPESLKGLDQGIAVGHAGGETKVYVGAAEVREGVEYEVVAVDDASGNLQHVWTGKETLSKDFGCSYCAGRVDVAVDDSSGLLGDWAAGDVYVSDQAHGVVDVFAPEAGEGEKKPIAELTGASPSEPFQAVHQVAVAPDSGDVVVADDVGVYIFKPAAIVGQYELVGKLKPPHGVSLSSGETRINASDGEGDIYVVTSDLKNIENKLVFEFNAAGEYEGQITPETAPNDYWGGERAKPSGVTADPVTHRVYVSTYDENKAAPVFVFSPNIVVPDVVADPASSVTTASATLNGTVDLDGAGAANCRFEWGTDPGGLGKVVPCPAKIEAAGRVPVSVPLSELRPDTTYYYRLQATNSNGASSSETEQFTTPGPCLCGESATSVTATSVTLDATINPNTSPTSYYFQYGRGGQYEAEAPVAPGAGLGSGAGPVEVSQHVQGLAAGTLYSYRVVAVSELGGKPVVFPGSAQTFTTQAVSAGSGLLDGRQWELVSPPQKQGALIWPIQHGLYVTKAASTGDAMTFIAASPTEAQPSGYDVGGQVFATRGSEGWSARDIMPPHEDVANANTEYVFFNEDLSLGVLQPVGGFSKSLSAEASEQTPYLRTDFPPGEPASQCAASCYRPLVTGKPGYANVPPGTVFGTNQFGVCPPQPRCGPLVLGGTPDLRHVVVYSNLGPLVEGAEPVGLYEWSEGKLALASVLPDGKPGGEEHTGVALGRPPLGGLAEHAISSDGSRVVWSNGIPNYENHYHLYLRDMARGRTIQLDAVQGGSGLGETQTSFDGASNDDSRVFFTAVQELTAGAHQEDLYECEIVVEASGKIACKLTDLTATRVGESAGFVGNISGVSEDGSWVYFAASGILAPGAVHGACKTSGGECNLYVWHNGVVRLVAVLSSEDIGDWGSGEKAANVTARVSPDGRWLAFMSQRQLTASVTSDAVTGGPDQEVYLYHAPEDLTGAAGQLTCASCNPSGARPVGIEVAQMIPGIDGLTSGTGTWSNSTRLAASVPGWTYYAQYELNDESNYQSRYLSDGGRLFFNSNDALVSQDVNGVGDVYEYEPPGAGDCTASSASFSARTGGCVGLVSSGTAAEEAGFLDASETGGDVFFFTTAQLSPQDTDTARDVYDAHECRSAAPCFAPVATQPPPCVTGDACKPAPTPQPSIFGSPASATFSGAGNVTEQAAPGGAAKPKTKSKAGPKTSTRARQLARVLKACHRQLRAKRRRACERTARRRYGGKASHRATANRRGG